MENQTITVTDLNTIRSIIDLACSRGAFHGAEMSEVGQLFDKLTDLDSNQERFEYLMTNKLSLVEREVNLFMESL